MAQKKSKKKKSSGRHVPRISVSVRSDTKRSMIGIVFFILAVFFTLSAYNIAGPVGDTIFQWLSMFLGAGYVFVPLLLFLLGLSLMRHIDFEEHDIAASKTIGAILFFLSGLGLSSSFFPDIGGSSIGAGGYLGDAVAWPFLTLFDIYVGAIFEGALLIISLLLIFDTPLSFEHRPLSWIKELFARKEKEDENDDVTVVSPLDDEETGEDITEEEYEDEEEVEDDDEEAEEDTHTPEKTRRKTSEDDGIALAPAYPLTDHTYEPPPLSLLSGDKGKPDVGDIKANANIIKRTLQNFGITVEMDEISVGPTVTRYALKPAEGVKLSRIVGLQNDLGLALAAHPVRIEAPIPGKSLVGIEVPNAARSTIGLAKLLSDPAYTSSDKPLLFALGRGISGQSFFSNLAKLPHGLIAGATGSGKSVTIHAILASLIYRNGPERMRFIMIDPKRVELTMYNSIPHLLTPVITDPKKAILALKWAAKEMDRRYDVLESESVRDIMSYHENIVGPAYDGAHDSSDDDAQLPEAMPYIVIIIDELADIMSSYPRELEASIVRLAQMSRAVGIHLILSTQRPSVNVITGLIKANIPGRIALQVSSQTDSRTILDAGGAEKLLGAGDMLYLSSDMAQPQRIQSAFVSENEIKKVVNYLKKQYAGEDTDDITLGGEDAGPSSLSDIMNGAFAGGDEDDDDLYEEARQTVVEAGKASTSFLQRKLKVGYARAARLMDMLEERGIVGPADGAKPREVLGGAGGMEGYGETEEEE